jgi:hypothetical protein
LGLEHRGGSDALTRSAMIAEYKEVILEMEAHLFATDEAEGDS